jgi:hypothetical protein
MQFSFDSIELGLSCFPILGLFTEPPERLHRSLKRSFRIVDVSGTNLRIVGFLAYLAKGAHQPQFGFYEIQTVAFQFCIIPDKVIGHFSYNPGLIREYRAAFTAWQYLIEPRPT